MDAAWKRESRSSLTRATAASNIANSWKMQGISTGSCIEPPEIDLSPSPNAWSIGPLVDSEDTVERAFGTLKRGHRMARARYLGAAKVGLQLHPGRHGLQPQEDRANGGSINGCSRGGGGLTWPRPGTGQYENSYPRLKYGPKKQAKYLNQSGYEAENQCMGLCSGLNFSVFRPEF